MIIQCAWCKKVMGEIIDNTGDRISHGICIPCKTRVLSEASPDKIPEGKIDRTIPAHEIYHRNEVNLK